MGGLSMAPRDAATSVQAHYRGFRTRVHVLNMVTSIRFHTAGGSCRLAQIVHAIRVLGAPCMERRPVDTTMLTQLLLKLERNVQTRDSGGPRDGTDIERTDVGFFTSKDDVERGRILDCMKLIAFEAGNVVFDQDQLSDGNFYFVLGGEVEVVIKDPDTSSSAPPRLLKRLSAGCSFGDRVMSALNAKRTARVVTVTDCLFGTLKRADFLRISPQFYDLAVDALELKPKVRLIEHHELLRNVLSDCALLRGEQRAALLDGIARSCTHKRLRKNELLFKEGEHAKSVYVVVRGHVRVVKGGNVVAVLGPGESFGEEGVTAVSDSERKRTASIVGGAVPGFPLSNGLVSPPSPLARPDDLSPSGGPRRDTMMCTDLAVIASEDYLSCRGHMDDAIVKALREKPRYRTEAQMGLLHTFFRNTEFFRAIGVHFIEHACYRQMRVQQSAPGDVVFSEGDMGGDTFYIIIHGSVSGTTEATNANFHLGAGDSFGDLALHGNTEADRVRTATIVCQEETAFATLSRVDYLQATGALHTTALDILNRPPDKRSMADTRILEGYLKEIKFFQDIHFPLLTQAVCKRLELLALDAGKVLYSQGDASSGRYYMLLQGTMKQETPTSHVENQYKILTVPDTWGDSSNALHPDTGKELPAAMLQCSRTVTALALQDTAATTAQMTVRVTGMPHSWRAAHIFESFATFGQIINVKVRQLQASFAVRYAEITFADRSAAERASQGGEQILRAVNKQQQSISAADVMGDCISNRLNKPVLVRGTSGGRVSIANPTSAAGDDKYVVQAVNFDIKSDEVESLIHEEVLLHTELKSDNDDAPRADVLVACLSREAYLECYHEIITRMMDILSSPPRNRSLSQLVLVQKMFSGTDLIRRLCKSTLVQRNCCRFLGVHTAKATEVIFKKKQNADRCFIIISGDVDLYNGDETLTRGPGALLGHESLLSPGEEKYQQEAVARSPTVLATITKSDYFRICDTTAVQAVIDKFWCLGLANSQSGHPSLLDFTGYKQVYLRLGKVIATKKMFSQKELLSVMKADWKSDLELFGDPQMKALTHGQYTDSMFQFIDEWSKAVESTKLYEEMLQLILDSMTRLHPKTGDLVLLPVRKVTCHYQQLADLCTEHQRQVKALVTHSTVGILEVGESDHVAHFKEMFRQKGIFKQGHAVDKIEEALTTKEIIQREKAYMVELFDSIDADRSGTIGRRELEHLFIKMGWDVTGEELEAAAIEMDPSGDGEIDLDEFISWVRRYAEEDDMIRALFDSIDEDGSGVLDYDEVRVLLNELGVDSANLDEATAAMDVDGNENVDVNEFIAWWRGYNSSYIVQESADAMQEYYRRMFDQADKDGNGKICDNELQVLLDNLGMPTDSVSVQLALAVMDENRDGMICWEEFKTWLDNIIATETEMSEFCENCGVDTSRGGLLSFEKAKNAIDFLCKRDGQASIEDEQLLAQVFPPGSSKYSDHTISFDVLCKWWLAYQVDPEAKATPQAVTHRTLGEDDDDDDDFDDLKGQAKPGNGVLNNGTIDDVGGWDASGGAGEVWTADGWMPVGDFETHDSDSDVAVAKKKRKKKKKRPAPQRKRTPKKEIDSQLLADAEAAEERQRRRAQKRSEQMATKRKQNSAPWANASRTSSRSSSRQPSAVSTPARHSAEQTDDPLEDFSDFVVQAQPRPRTTQPEQRSHIHSSGFRRLPTAPYQPHAARRLMHGRHTKPNNARGLSMVHGGNGLCSQSMPDLERPISATWKERDMTIAPCGEDVVKMPSLKTPPGTPEQNIEKMHEESDLYREYREAEERSIARQREHDVAYARSMNELYERGLVVEYEKLALQDPHQQQRGSRMIHTAAERQFYETVNWEYQGPSPRASPTASPMHSPIHSPMHSPRHSPRHSRQVVNGYSEQSYSPVESEVQTSSAATHHESPRNQSVAVGHDDGLEGRLDLIIAGRQSPRHYSPRTTTQVEAIRAVARRSSPFASPRSKEAAKAMLLNQAEVTSVLVHTNHQRNLMRTPTAASFAPDLEARTLPSGVMATKSELEKRARYKTPTDRTDRNVLQWFAEHGSAKSSMRTMSRGPGPQRKAFAHDWRSPSGCGWKLADSPTMNSLPDGVKNCRASNVGVPRPHIQRSSNVLGSYGSLRTGRDTVGHGAQRDLRGWQQGSRSQQDFLWNHVVQTRGEQSLAATTPTAAALW